MSNDLFLRMRQYTFFDMVGFAPYFANNRYNGTIEELLASYYNLNNKLVRTEEDAIAVKITIIEAVTVDFFKLPLEQVRSDRKYNYLVKARQIMCGIACRMATEDKVATVLSRKRDFIHYNKAKCEFYCSHEKGYKLDYDQIEKRCVIEINKKFRNEDNKGSE